MYKIPQHEYTAGFKKLAVRRVKAGEMFGALARDLPLLDLMVLQLFRLGAQPTSIPPGARYWVDFPDGGAGRLAW